MGACRDHHVNQLLSGEASCEPFGACDGDVEGVGWAGAVKRRVLPHTVALSAEERTALVRADLLQWQQESRQENEERRRREAQESRTLLHKMEESGIRDVSHWRERMEGEEIHQEQTADEEQRLQQGEHQGQESQQGRILREEHHEPHQRRDGDGKQEPQVGDESPKEQQTNGDQNQQEEL